MVLFVFSVGVGCNMSVVVDKPCNLKGALWFDPFHDRTNLKAIRFQRSRLFSMRNGVHVYTRFLFSVRVWLTDLILLSNTAGIIRMGIGSGC